MATDIKRYQRGMPPVIDDPEASGKYIDGELEKLESAIRQIDKFGETIEQTVGDNTAAITNEQTVRADADTALTNSVNSLTATVNQNTADITTEQTARANGDSANASSITTLNSTVNGLNSTVTTQAGTIANINGQLGAYYGIEVGAGNVASFKLLSDNSSVGSAISLSASQIQLNGNVLVNGTVTANEIATNAITTAKINNNSVSTPKIINESVTEMAVGEATKTGAANSHSITFTVDNNAVAAFFIEYHFFGSFNTSGNTNLTTLTLTRPNSSTNFRTLTQNGGAHIFNSRTMQDSETLSSGTHTIEGSYSTSGITNPSCRIHIVAIWRYK